MSSSEIFDQHALDMDRHAGEQAPSNPIPKPTIGSSFELDPMVIEAFPEPGTRVISACNYGTSLWGQTAKIDVELPSKAQEVYFLKAISRGDTGYLMIKGEFESLRLLGNVSPSFVPTAYGWGKFNDKTALGGDVYFLLTSFHEVGQQPPNPSTFTARLADLHQRSESPNGKFGFRFTTCLATLPQVTDRWEESWAALYKEQLSELVRMDSEKNGKRPEFQPLCTLILNKVIPRLLEPLQSGGRSIKPCLVHGDLWDENTATDAATGEPFIFDPCSFYAHNEYELGNWRAARHRLSAPAYIESYKEHFPPSEPKDEWDDRNRLYSLRFDLAAAILFPDSNQRRVVKDNMTFLCHKFFPEDLLEIEKTGISVEYPIKGS